MVQIDSNESSSMIYEGIKQTDIIRGKHDLREQIFSEKEIKLIV